MAFLDKRCPECGNRIIVDTQKWDTQIVYVFKCGHWLCEDIVETSSPLDFSPSNDGKELYKFQKEGIEFAVQSNAVCLIADEMGLGKTVQYIRTLSSRPADLLPALLVCKSKLKIQHLHEFMRWTRPKHKFMPYIIQNGKDPIVPGFDLYICSQDLLKSFVYLDKKDEHKMIDELTPKLKLAGVKTVVIDEVQHIKNHQTQRAVSVRTLCKEILHKIALSGTPIENKAPEYFSILNILRPDLYPVYERFCNSECDYYTNEHGVAKWGGLRDPDRFFEKTKDFIIRRKRDEVDVELPAINRQHVYTDLEAKTQKAYDKLVGEFLDYQETSEESRFVKEVNLMAFLAKMRHCVGQAKVDTTIDYVMEFLGSSEDKKIIVFVHHKDVHADMLDKLTAICRELELDDPLSLVAEMSTREVTETIEIFKGYRERRVLIASTLAFGEGLNLQCASDAVLAERQWNPSKEEQAVVGRIARLGQLSKKCNITYVVAMGTIDEWLAELIERKRAICANTLDYEDIEWSESDIIQEITKRLIETGRPKWSYR